VIIDKIKVCLIIHDFTKDIYIFVYIKHILAKTFQFKMCGIKFVGPLSQSGVHLACN